MKRTIALAVMCLAAVMAIAATCTLRNESLTKIGDHDTFGGELFNGSGVDVLQHRFLVSFLNSNGAIVETRLVDGCLRSLQAGESDFFSVSSSEPSDTTTVALARMANIAEDPKFRVGKVKDGQIAILDVVVYRMGTTLTVKGKLTNEDNDELEDPAVCVVVWNDDERVLTVQRETGLPDLAENESADFDIEVTVPDDTDLVHLVDVRADGLENGIPVEPGLEEGYEIAVTPVPTSTATSTVTPTGTATPTATATAMP